MGSDEKSKVTKSGYFFFKYHYIYILLLFLYTLYNDTIKKNKKNNKKNNKKINNFFLQNLLNFYSASHTALTGTYAHAYLYEPLRAYVST